MGQIDKTLIDKIEKVGFIATMDYEQAFASLKHVMQSRERVAIYILKNSLREEDVKTGLNQIDYLNDIIKKTLSL